MEHVNYVVVGLVIPVLSDFISLVAFVLGPPTKIRKRVLLVRTVEQFTPALEGATRPVLRALV